jgi:hypothetical protein
MNRENIGLIAVFQFRSHTLVVGTTHIYFNYKRPDI